MTDRDVQHEIEANEQRADQHERDEDGGIIDTAERLLNPLVETIHRAGDDTDQETVVDRGRMNDAEQRPE